MENPLVFIGSSTEGLKIAEIIQQQLENEIETTLWNQNIFEPSSYSLESLKEALQFSNFGIFVFTPDDFLEIRTKKYKSARDNVIFELGLFIGKLGHDHCFIIKPKDIKKFHIPTDLIGLTTIEYNENRNDNNLKAALGPVCTTLKQIIKKRMIQSQLNFRQKQSSLQLSDILLLIENGNQILKNRENGYSWKFKSYLIILDLIGFESMNKKFGESFCNEILKQIERIVRNRKGILYRRIGDTFIFFCNRESDSEAISVANMFKNDVVNFNWDKLANELYINMTGVVSTHNPDEDVLSWIQRTMENMRYAKKNNILEITISKNKPKKVYRPIEYDFS